MCVGEQREVVDAKYMESRLDFIFLRLDFFFLHIYLIYYFSNINCLLICGNSIEFQIIKFGSFFF